MPKSKTDHGAKHKTKDEKYCVKCKRYFSPETFNKNHTQHNSQPNIKQI